MLASSSPHGNCRSARLTAGLLFARWPIKVVVCLADYVHTPGMRLLASIDASRIFHLYRMLHVVLAEPSLVHPISREKFACILEAFSVLGV